MGQNFGGAIVKDNLVLALDAADQNSYPGTGTSWYNVATYSPNTSIPSAGTWSNSVMNYVYNYSTIGTIDQGIYENTMECWFYVPSGGSYSGCCDTLFGQYWFRTFIIGQGLYTMIGFANQNGSYNTYQHPSYSVSYDQWHWTAGMRRGNNYIIWIDGVEVYNSTFGSGLPLYSTGGTWYVSSSTHPNIKVASARVYNIGLTDAQLLNNYNVSKRRFGL